MMTGYKLRKMEGIQCHCYMHWPHGALQYASLRCHLKLKVWK